MSRVPYRTWLSTFLTTLLILAFALPVSGEPPIPPEQQPGEKQFTRANIPPQAVEFRDAPGAEPYQFDLPQPLAYAMQSANAATATIVVHYVPAGGTNMLGDSCLAFPADAKAAFDAAAQVWSNLLVSNVPITIEACWANLPPGVLGHSGPSGFFEDEFGVLYPQALANALQGSALSSDDDMSIAYANGYANQFYFGTDGRPPLNKTDFMSVVMHEIAHGLGFLGSLRVSGSYGLWGLFGGAYPIVYDKFAVDSLGRSLLDTSVYPNPSTELRNTLLSAVYFNGANAKAAYGGRPIPLYAPSYWVQGSSYSHLDFDTFYGTENSLMVYAISPGSSIHHPGPITMGLLQDIGWATGANVDPPGAFAKSSPGPGAGSVTQNTLLIWGPAAGATSYTYCYDTTNNNACDGTWRPAATNSAIVTRLNSSTVYYWQVRAINSGGTTDANGGDWWSFTTQSQPLPQRFLPAVFNQTAVLK